MMTATWLGQMLALAAHDSATPAVCQEGLASHVSAFAERAQSLLEAASSCEHLHCSDFSGEEAVEGQPLDVVVSITSGTPASL